MQSKSSLRLYLIPKLSDFFSCLLFLVFAIASVAIGDLFAYPFLGCLLMLAFSIGSGYKPVQALINAFKTVKELDENGTLNAVLQEFSDAQALMKGQMRLGDKHLFGKGAGMIHPYNTLRRIYQHVERVNGAEVKRELIAIDTSGRKHSVCRLPKSQKYASELQTAAMLIAVAQPSITFGAP